MPGTASGPFDWSCTEVVRYRFDLLLGLFLSGRGTWLFGSTPPPFLVGVLLLDALGFFNVLISSSDSVFKNIEVMPTAF